MSDIDYAAQLTATAAERRYQLRPWGDRRFGQQALYRLQPDGRWKLAARDCSPNWYRILDNVRRGWAILDQ